MDDRQTLDFIRKRLPSREKIESLRSAVLLADDAEELLPVIENLLTIRQAALGGRRNPRGSRHWDDE